MDIGAGCEAAEVVNYAFAADPCPLGDHPPDSVANCNCRRGTAIDNFISLVSVLNRPQSSSD
ncbi:hypothetical protein MJO29_001646 [Puccinia striiformis f. sp. tritici]|nr:hypothetical protein MJO29_001646 [Puccinia striiformis f. sp. tritici]